MELTKEHSKAAGSLFAVALRTLQARGQHEQQEDRVNNIQVAGEGEVIEPLLSGEGPVGEHEAAQAAAQSAESGLDRLCQRVFSRLGISEIDSLPLVSLARGEADDALHELIRQHAATLDTPRPAMSPNSFTSSPHPPPAPHSEASPPPPGSVQPALAGPSPPASDGGSTSAKSAPHPKASNGVDDDHQFHVSNSKISAGSGTKAHGSAPETASSSSMPSPSSGSSPRLTSGGPGTSAQPSGPAVTAVAALLLACLPERPAPTLESALQEAGEAGKAAGVSGKQDKTAGKGGMGGDPDAAPPPPAAPVSVWYDARARAALRLLATWLHVPWRVIALHESLLADESQAHLAGERAPEALQEGESAMGRQMRYLKIGAAAVGGGALLAITGGLAAPALAAVAGSVLTTAGAGAAAGALTSAVGSTLGTAALIGGFGAGGARAVGGRMAHRLGDLEEFGFLELQGSDVDAEGSSEATAEQAAASPTTSSSWLPSWSRKAHDASSQDMAALLPVPVVAAEAARPHMAVTVAVPGWLRTRADVGGVWSGLARAEGDATAYALAWETKELLELSTSLVDMIKSKAAREAGKYIIENYVVHGLFGALGAPLWVLNAAGWIDTSWRVVMNRAALAGKLLARVLMSGAHGGVPVTLIGYSMGARLIYECLVELARCGAAGVVEDALLLGAPVSGPDGEWRAVRSVVAGRLVNAYSTRDWVLGLSFRAREVVATLPAGLMPLPEEEGITNIDISPLVGLHTDYITNMADILAAVGFVDPDPQET